jgi:two-component system, NarL family, sensor histidine kinase UhpB
MNQPLRLLLVEDSEDDAILMLRALRRAGYDPIIERVQTAATLKAALDEKPWDVVISDYVMPDFNGLAALSVVKEKGLDLPFIIVSGQIGEDIAVAAMKSGAHDYLMKDKLARLGPAIERELREAEVRRNRQRANEALRESEERFRQLAENIGAVFFMWEAVNRASPGRITYASPAYERVWGHAREALDQNGQSWLDAVHHAHQEQIAAALPKMMQGDFDEQFQIVRADLKVRWIHFRVFPVRNERAQVYRVAGIAEDITERKWSEKQLEEYARQLRETVEQLKITEEELRASNADLSKARADLERRVRERTADLMAANAELQRQMEERRRLENELLDITEKERQRIGIDLHDDLGQHLNGIALLLEGLELKLNKKSDSAAAEVGRIQALILKTINHAHNLAQNLATVNVQGKDLCSALKNLCSRAKAMFEISCRCVSEGTIPALEPTVVNQLYKIAQEAVTNAIKHGKAKQVQINLSFALDKLTLTIRNNGEPFPEAIDHSNRMGLRIMQYRARVVGATVQVRANGAKGTIVTCILPSRLVPTAPVGRRTREVLAGERELFQR